MTSTTKNPTAVVTGEVRLSYANLITPKPNDKGKDVWSVLLLIPKTDVGTLKRLKAAAEAALAAGKANGKLKANASLASAWTTLKDGDEHDDLGEKPEYAGHYLMNVNAYRAPGVVDRRLNPIVDASEIYSGCYARVSINAYAYNYENTKRGITFGLNHVQKMRDGEPLGNITRAEDVFDALEDADAEDGEEFSII